MKTKKAIALALAVLGAAVIGTQGCSGAEVPIAHNDTALYGGVIDAGTGLCGNVACGDGELCCAGSDEYCSPTCMKVSSCPAYGRPCKTPPDAGTGADAGSGDSATADAPTTVLQWYTTCGDPVCGTPDASAPTPTCPKEGTACTTKGQTCGDGSTTCGSVLVCDDHDPKSGGCPISSAKFKDDIHYLGDADLAQLHDETLSMRLASYKYKGPWAHGSDATHLGFIIEDQPQSLSVERGHDRVDMYGYLSMVVASMQVQEREIQALKKELAATKTACGKRD